ncbi:hypothetical protein ASG29_15635 [Sphingomonas sp. Leaf412]|uniref:endonuclease domain-containing protein n=1 Tax=Sphingomonas sp. Leaf412 TaxID=1736370 RepID=UPI000700BFBD|nr:DUF559 domain-containing protein [Sphingomonas sp. Leaf412]KQT31373.1 hypothetical protein ASG29_15635 [Sphingomonas sp. Leaf412]
MRGNALGLTKRQLLAPDTVVRSRALRRESGEPERRMWRALRQQLAGAKFRRQVPLGRYHADFCSHAARLVIEIDGDDHAARSRDDAVRTRFMQDEGYRVLRFSNADVMRDVDSVIVAIAAAIRHEKGDRS